MYQGFLKQSCPCDNKMNEKTCFYQSLWVTLSLISYWLGDVCLPKQRNTFFFQNLLETGWHFHTPALRGVYIAVIFSVRPSSHFVVLLDLRSWNSEGVDLFSRPGSLWILKKKYSSGATSTGTGLRRLYMWHWW